MAGKPFQEILCITDDQTWVWSIMQAALEKSTLSFVRLPSNTSIRHSWQRFKNTPCILLHWELSHRNAGAIIEEILDVDPHFDVGEKIVVLTENPMHEDVVYFAELGLRRIIRLRAREKEITEATGELHTQVQEATTPHELSTQEAAWQKMLFSLDTLLSRQPQPPEIDRIEVALQRLRGLPHRPTARELDVMATISYLRGHLDEATKLWHQALEKNGNYFRAYRNLIKCLRSSGKHDAAFQLLQKLHSINKSSVSRLVNMGEVQLDLTDYNKAEHYFQLALEKDHYASGALNGMAEIRFAQGDLDATRNLLQRSRLAYKYAAKLNQMGVELVKKGNFSEALDHYTRAQYVLPQQEKGAQLFFNIALCYSKWDKNDMAKEFIKLALIKEPNYKKAQRLLAQIDAGQVPDVAA